MIRVTADAQGWVKTIIEQEVNRGGLHEIGLAAMAARARERGEVVLIDALPAPLETLPLALLRLEVDYLTTPHDDRIAWRRLRQAGQNGAEAFARCRPVARDLYGLPDSGPVMVPTTPGLGVTHDFPAVEGLRLRPLSHDDMEAMAGGAVQAGIQPARCPDEQHPCCRPPEAHAWLHLAQRIDRDDTWQLCLEWQGQPLQMELVTVSGEQATFSYTAHFNRERPPWFWRETERPVFERLKDAGVTSIISRTRNDRPDWIATLKDNYGAVEVGSDARATRLRFAPDQAIARCQGWPSRRALGWSWQRGDVTVREATPLEYPACRAHAAASWGDGHSRQAIGLRVFDEWTRFDAATVLVCEVDGQLTGVRLMRQRRGTSGGTALPTRWLDGPESMLFTYGCTVWAQEAGYAELITYMPTALIGAPGVARKFAAAGAVPVREILGGHTQYRQDVAAALARPESAWTD